MSGERNLMDRPVKVSVVVPVYNKEKYLRKCVDSILQQTLTEIQIILVDDGSTDESGEICRGYEKNDPRVLYMHKENGGTASARSVGLEHADGTYVGFVDADDWIERDMYEKMYRTAADYDADIVFCNLYQGESTEGKKVFETGLYNRKDIERVIFPRVLCGYPNGKAQGTIRWSNCLRLYRKSKIDRHHIKYYLGTKRCEDMAFNFECTMHAEKLYYMGDHFLYHNRYVPDSKSKGYSYDMWPSIKRLLVYLESIVSQYELYDFSEQLRYRNFFSIIDCIDNEARAIGQRSLKDRILEIRMIARDPLTRQSITAIDTKCLPKLIKAYHLAMVWKMPVMLYCIACYRQKNARRAIREYQDQ